MLQVKHLLRRDLHLVGEAFGPLNAGPVLTLKTAEVGLEFCQCCLAGIPAGLLSALVTAERLVLIPDKALVLLQQGFLLVQVQLVEQLNVDRLDVLALLGCNLDTGVQLPCGLKVPDGLSLSLHQRRC